MKALLLVLALLLPATVAEGALAVVSHATAWIAEGNYTETFVIGRPMFLRSSGGDAVIGQRES